MNKNIFFITGEAGFIGSNFMIDIYTIYLNYNIYLL